MATKLIFSSSGSLQIQTGTSAGSLMRNVTHLLFLPAERAAQRFVSACDAAEFHRRGLNDIGFKKKSEIAARNLNSTTLSVSQNFQDEFDCFSTHKVAGHC